MVTEATKKKPHPLEYWMAKPVCIQFKGPYVICRDSGPEDVEVEGSGGEKKTVTFGKPVGVVTDNGPVATPTLSGVLYDDPCDPAVLIFHTTQELNLRPDGKQTVKLEVRVLPSDIAFISVIPEREEPPRIVSVTTPLKRP